MGEKEREIVNLRKLLDVEKQNITDLMVKYGELKKSKEASFAKTKAELLSKNAELVFQNTLLLRKFEDQGYETHNGELSKAKQLASSQGSLILRDDDLEKVKNRVISDLGDIEANNSLELSDQIEQYKLL